MNEPMKPNAITVEEAFRITRAFKAAQVQAELSYNHKRKLAVHRYAPTGALVELTHPDGWTLTGVVEELNPNPFLLHSQVYMIGPVNIERYVPGGESTPGKFKIIKERWDAA